jgi:hypothetical protein
MDLSEAVRLFTAVSHDVIAATLQQFRIEQEAARAADRAQFRKDLENARAADQAYFSGHFSNLQLRLDRLEVADRLRSSLPASASTSFSSSTSCSTLGQGSPSTHAVQMEIPKGRNDGAEFFLDPDDDDHGLTPEMFFNFGENVTNEPRSPCSGIAAISLTEPWPGPHAAHRSCAPIHSSYELGVSTGEANLHDPLPVQPGIPTTWAPIPTTCQPGVSTHNDHQDMRVAEPISSSRQSHNPRVCALCAFPFAATKYRIMMPKSFCSLLNQVRRHCKKHMLQAFQETSQCKFTEGFRDHEDLIHMFAGDNTKCRWTKFVERYTRSSRKRGISQQKNLNRHRTSPQ